MTQTSNLYQRVKDYVLAGISNGSWQAGERVPSENELVDLCKVSRMTARRALQELLHEGTLIRIKGKGSFVAEEKQHSSLLQINSIAAEVKAKGMQHSSALLHLEAVDADPDIAQSLNLSEGDRAFYSEVVHYQNQVPVQVELRWVNPDTAPEYLEQDFELITPGEYLTEILPVTEAEHQIEAVLGDKQLRDTLQVEKNEALLLLNRKTWCGDKLVSFARLYHPGNRYSFGTKFSAN
jgi:GntR family transcriptional regulator, histidine utilization repressor